MRVLAAFILIACFSAIGSGALAYVHDLQHAREDALEDRSLKAAGQPVDAHHHDESNCHIHAQLHAPTMAVAVPAFFLGVGGWVAFLSELPPVAPPARAFSTIACRGPPALRFS